MKFLARNSVESLPMVREPENIVVDLKSNSVSQHIAIPRKRKHLGH
jgi:hypothetical protein